MKMTQSSSKTIKQNTQTSQKGGKDIYNLERFKRAQAENYETALGEIRNGRKESHWMRYIFPKIEGLGSSFNAQHYAITSLDEAKAYLSDPELRSHLIEISLALLDLKQGVCEDILGIVDALKLQSCMTLFLQAEPDNDVFQKIIDNFYNGELDLKTLSILGVLGDELHARLEKVIWSGNYDKTKEMKRFKEGLKERKGSSKMKG